MSVRATKNYREEMSEITDEVCDTCGEQLNETEVVESERHTNIKLCTTHLHQALGIPE